VSSGEPCAEKNAVLAIQSCLEALGAQFVLTAMATGPYIVGHEWPWDRFLDGPAEGAVRGTLSVWIGVGGGMSVEFRPDSEADIDVVKPRHTTTRAITFGQYTAFLFATWPADTGRPVGDGALNGEAKWVVRDSCDGLLPGWTDYVDEAHQLLQSGTLEAALSSKVRAMLQGHTSPLMNSGVRWSIAGDLKAAIAELTKHGRRSPEETESPSVSARPDTPGAGEIDGLPSGGHQPSAETGRDSGGGTVTSPTENSSADATKKVDGQWLIPTSLADLANRLANMSVRKVKSYLKQYGLKEAGNRQLWTVRLDLLPSNVREQLTRKNPPPDPKKSA
jgi:hypothetical protein